MYKFIFKNVFSKMDPEQAHHLVYTGISVAGKIPFVSGVIEGAIAPYLQGQGVEVFGRRVPAPFGLAGGFDKDARAVRGLTMLGFGFVEIGTVTAQAQPGNEKPRMWREIGIGGLRNRMGFNNEGAQAAARELAKLRASKKGRSVFVGVNIGKTKVTPADQAAEDYAFSARLLAPYADYLVVNVSSPNTPGLRDLQSVDALRPILEAVRKAADESTTDKGLPRVPLLVKIAPDLADEDIQAVAGLARDLELDGVAAVNTTINHDLGPGGLSGKPELERGLEVVGLLRSALGADSVIIGVGGITTGEDAQRYIDAGANLVQGYTGFIYEGPLWARRINKKLLNK
ncbi:quinone-dependent dihydroorotate dehydrogenase [Timonella sp. A28]|uniref:quinone-dependent dihydroorotate dehydrogenase n=1 Tax=Timonella sp. A28 TaxID=3442640 RepID=UPI003EBA8599